jgi:hypothetical protein
MEGTMKRTTFIGSAGVTALVASLPEFALAQSQMSSDQNLRVAGAIITGLIAQLDTERGDYGGQRKAAIAKLQDAQNEINAALATVNAGKPTQAMSDAVMRHVQGRIDALASQIKEARADYGGHRAAAIRDLEAASSDLGAALQTR